MSEHVLERLSAFLDGELRREEQVGVREHLARCPACAQRLEELAALDATARALPSPAPAGYFEALPGRVRARLEPRARRPRWPVWSLAAAAALMLAVLTPAVLQRRAAPAGTPLEEPAPALAPDTGRRESQALEDEALPRKPAPPVATAPATPPADAITPSVTPRVLRGRSKPRKEAEPGPVHAPAATPPLSAQAPQAPIAGPVPEQDPRQDAAAERRLAVRDRDAAQEAVAEGRFTTGAAAMEKRVQGPNPDARYAWLLRGAAPQNVDEARALREAWRSFAREHPSHAGADEARVRALEAGAEAYRLGRNAPDLDAVRADAADYLARPDAAQPDRVRALLDRLDPR